MRKIGVPFQPELAMGAVVDGGTSIIVRNEDVIEHAGILAFSPGEYLAGASSVRSAAAQLSIPIFVTSAKESGEVAQAKAILDAAAARQKVQFVPNIAGVHGSSTLRSDRNPKGADENWAAVKAFLASLAP